MSRKGAGHFRLQSFVEIDYAPFHDVINARDFMAQDRRRIFIVLLNRQDRILNNRKSLAYYICKDVMAQARVLAEGLPVRI